MECRVLTGASVKDFPEREGEKVGGEGKKDKRSGGRLGRRQEERERERETSEPANWTPIRLNRSTDAK